jgi:hypothetical protein
MSTTETRYERSATRGRDPVDMKLEVIVLPVADADRAKLAKPQTRLPGR